MRLLLFVSYFLLNTLSTVVNSSACSEHQCIAVVDAGSTGSRLHVFSYDLDQTKTPIHITEVWSKKNQPGLASLDTKPESIESYINTLFAGAPQHNIPVYFYATAGMRLVSQSKQKIYYQSLAQWFQKNPSWHLVNAKTITGNEEALFDWLAVNYHLKTLQNANPNNYAGVLDFGGASTQIAFPLQEQQRANADSASIIDLNLYGQHISLFVYSFLGLGQNEMAHQTLRSKYCFATNYPLPDGTLGQGNAVECKQELTSLINGVHKANQIIQPTLSANPVNSWYAIGGLSYLAESKPFQFTQQQFTNIEFLNQAHRFTCDTSWHELHQQEPNNEYLDTYCLLPAFYYALMVDGYGFSQNQAVNFISPGQNLDWTLGVVLYH